MNIAGQIAGQDRSNTSYFVRQPASFEGQPGAKHYAGSKQAQPELGDFSGHSLCSRSYYSAGNDCIYSEMVLPYSLARALVRAMTPALLTL